MLSEVPIQRNGFLRENQDSMKKRHKKKLAKKDLNKRKKQSLDSKMPYREKEPLELFFVQDPPKDNKFLMTTGIMFIITLLAIPFIKDISTIQTLEHPKLFLTLLPLNAPSHAFMFGIFYTGLFEKLTPEIGNCDDIRESQFAACVHTAKFLIFIVFCLYVVACEYKLITYLLNKI